jgi:hypothetical protein
MEAFVHRFFQGANPETWLERGLTSLHLSLGFPNVATTLYFPIWFRLFPEGLPYPVGRGWPNALQQTLGVYFPAFLHMNGHFFFFFEKQFENNQRFVSYFFTFQPL